MSKAAARLDESGKLAPKPGTGILLLPNTLTMATSTVARFTVPLNPAAFCTLATRLSPVPPNKPLMSMFVKLLASPCA